jgi:hypothetical protein
MRVVVAVIVLAVAGLVAGLAWPSAGPRAPKGWGLTPAGGQTPAVGTPPCPLPAGRRRVVRRLRRGVKAASGRCRCSSCRSSGTRSASSRWTTTSSRTRRASAALDRVPLRDLARRRLRPPDAVLAQASSVIVASLPAGELDASRRRLLDGAEVPVLLVRPGLRPSGVAGSHADAFQLVAPRRARLGWRCGHRRQTTGSAPGPHS